MELEKLDITQLGPNLMREGPAVGCGHPRVGGDRVQLADSTGCQDHGGSRERSTTTAASKNCHTSDGRSVSQQSSDLGVLQQLNARVAAHHLRQASNQRCPSPVPTGMDNSGPGVGSFEPEAQPPVGAAIEDRSQSQELVNPVRAFTCENPDGLGVG
jgi:hypothetical protein